MSTDFSIANHMKLLSIMCKIKDEDSLLNAYSEYLVYLDTKGSANCMTKMYEHILNKVDLKVQVDKEEMYVTYVSVSTPTDGHIVDMSIMFKAGTTEIVSERVKEKALAKLSLINSIQ